MNLKPPWPNLLASLLGGGLSAAFALGFSWALLGDRVGAAERRLDEIDKAQVAQVRWQVEQDSGSIATLRADARQTESAIAQVNVRLGVIDAKLDAIAEAIHRTEVGGSRIEN
ncbi:MAG TPA: hypothetical protein VH370_07910 [Humisphaera sp.]|jgi:hypothetical protein|nr:hypothetical protein [Humisphaera sp.]